MVSHKMSPGKPCFGLEPTSLTDYRHTMFYYVIVEKWMVLIGSHGPNVMIIACMIRHMSLHSLRPNGVCGPQAQPHEMPACKTKAHSP